MSLQSISTAVELVSAAQNPSISEIEVTCDLDLVPSFTLSPGQTIRSLRGEMFLLRFVQGADGLQLTTNNRVSSLSLQASPNKRAPD